MAVDTTITYGELVNQLKAGLISASQNETSKFGSLNSAYKSGYTKEFTYSQFWLEMGMRNSFYTDEDIRTELPKYDPEITNDILNDNC